MVSNRWVCANCTLPISAVALLVVLQLAALAIAGALKDWNAKPGRLWAAAGPPSVLSTRDVAAVRANRDMVFIPRRDG